MMTLAAAVLTATLAFAQTDTGGSNSNTGSNSGSTTEQTTPNTTTNAARGTTYTTTGAGATTSGTMTGQTTDTTGTPMNTAATTQSDGDRGFGSTMMWLIPLLIIFAFAVPFIRRRMSGQRNDMPASPRV